ncbi:MAG: MerR family transcriptional regulator [Bacteroidales bacterium]|jgi:DNA-binding transcriptional MerR regulator|nr:MerR family transcriptional regulator [Bacteroidales bacterium]
MPNYSIKDLENLTGIQAHTIRIWEQRYKLLSPERTPTNIRIYSDKDLRKLLSVALLNNNGLKISKIAKLSDTDVAEAVLRLAESTDSNLENHINTLKLIMIEMNEAKFEKLFSHLVLQMGFEETIMRVFVPFFKRLAYLWQTESVSLIQIYFISSLFKQKLYVAIDGLTTAEAVDKKTFILFLPKTEFLDNNLIFCNYLSRKAGHKVYYFGVSSPADEIIDLLQKNPGCYLISVVSMAQIDVTAYYNKILAACNDGQQLVVSGNQANIIKISDPRFTYFEDLADYKKMLDNL